MFIGYVTQQSAAAVSVFQNPISRDAIAFWLNRKQLLACITLDQDFLRIIVRWLYTEIDEDVPLRLMTAECDFERMSLYMSRVRIHRMKQPMSPRDVQTARLRSRFPNLQQIIGYDGIPGHNFFNWTIERDERGELSCLTLSLGVTDRSESEPGSGLFNPSWGVVPRSNVRDAAHHHLRLKSLTFQQYNRTAYNFSSVVIDNAHQFNEFKSLFLPAGVELDEEEPSEDRTDIGLGIDQLAPYFRDAETLVLHNGYLGPAKLARLGRFATRLHTVSLIGTDLYDEEVWSGEKWTDDVWSVFDRIQDLSIHYTLFSGWDRNESILVLLKALCARPTSQLRRFTLSLSLQAWMEDKPISRDGYQVLPEIPSWPTQSKLEHVTVYFSHDEILQDPATAAHLLIQMFPATCSIEIIPQITDWLADKPKDGLWINGQMRKVAQGILSTRRYLLGVLDPGDRQRRPIVGYERVETNIKSGSPNSPE